MIARYFVLVLLTAGPFTPACAQGARVAIAWTEPDGSSAVQAFDVEAPWLALTVPLAIDRGSRLNFTGDKLYALSPSEGTLTVIDTLGWSVEQTYFLGADSRPIDIAVSDAVAYITRETATRLLRLDLSTGALSESVDFTPMADADGIPDLGTMILDGERLLVQVRRLNPDALEFFERPAYVAIVDLATETLVDVDTVEPGVQGIALGGTAPLFRMQIGPLPRRLFVSSSYNTHNTEGGIEMIDLDTLQSLGIVAAENDLASGVCCEMAPFVMVSPSKGYFTFSTDSTLSSHLHFFTLEDGIDPADLYTSLDYEAANHVYDVFTDHLFVPALEQTPGFHVFAAASGTRLSSSIVPTPGNISDLVLLCGCGDVSCGFRRECPSIPATSRGSLLALMLLLGLVGLVQLRQRLL